MRAEGAHAQQLCSHRVGSAGKVERRLGACTLCLAPSIRITCEPEILTRRPRAQRGYSQLKLVCSFVERPHFCICGSALELMRSRCDLRASVRFFDLLRRRPRGPRYDPSLFCILFKLRLSFILILATLSIFLFLRTPFDPFVLNKVILA